VLSTNEPSNTSSQPHKEAISSLSANLSGSGKFILSEITYTNVRKAKNGKRFTKNVAWVKTFLTADRVG
jgi:hypothetical protein